jgi:hypothetical protein
VPSRHSNLHAHKDVLFCRTSCVQPFQFNSAAGRPKRKEKEVKRRKHENNFGHIWKLYTFVYYPHLREHFIVFFHGTHLNSKRLLILK